MCRALLLVLGLVYLTSCATLPPEPKLEATYADQSTSEGLLAEAVASIVPPLGGEESGFLLLPGASDALAWRIALIDSAVRSIDVQYFLWHDDAVGADLLERLYKAADRGVKVRLLVDDLHLAAHEFLKGNDKELAAVDQHPNLDFRLFNPGHYRQGTAGTIASLGTDALHYNRRMHNKLMVFDNHFAIVGGRNIGNEYFGLAEEFNFIDLDVLVTGAVIPQLSSTFDDYWNSDFPYPALALADVDQDDFLEMREGNRRYAQSHAELLRGPVLASEMKVEQLGDIGILLERGKATFYRDDPVQREESESRLYEEISSLILPGYEEMITSSPYLIFARDFFQLTKTDIGEGARVRILTNSLATNNQPAVHAHYKKYREQLLGIGVELHELHHLPSTELRALVETEPTQADFIGLHMKSSVIDGRRCFIGTMNLDPRSLDINTEDILDIESEGLCSQLRDYLLLILEPESSWQVSRDQKGKLNWTSYEGVVDKQPARKGSQRIMDPIYQIMPEKQL